ncbi:hypothetical protein [Nocardioides gilvus]|uniref:hypothetical protein n=1 Tax=Nocardioides gilvus TaxID=1735589 RepID=UPI000D74D36F|nr:hypothetical protein [Nocardioides gilvus]
MFLEVRPRHGVLAALAVATATLAGHAGHWRSWLGVWSETDQYLSSSFILTAPVAAAAGAFFGAAARRNGVAERRHAAGRSAWLVQLRAAAEPAAWVALGLLLGTVPAWIATAFVAVNGFPNPLSTLAHVGALAAVTALGQQVGGQLPWFLGVPVAAAVLYVGLGVLAFNAETLLIALTPLDDGAATFERPMAWVLLAQIVLWLTVLAAVVAHRADQTRTRFLLVVGVAVLTVPLLYVTPSTRALIKDAATQQCEAAGQLTLCLPRAKAVVRPDLTPEYEQAVTALQGLVADRVTLVDDETAALSPAIDRDLALLVEREELGGAEVIPLSLAGSIDTYTKFDRNGIHLYFISYLVPASDFRLSEETGPDEPDDGDLRRAAMPSDILHRWYFTEVGVPIGSSTGMYSPMLDETFVNYGDRAELFSCFSSLTPEDRAAWFRKHRDEVREGAVTWENLKECSS